MNDINFILDNLTINDDISKIMNEEVELLKQYILNCIEENKYDEYFFTIQPNDYIVSIEEYEKIIYFINNNENYLFDKLIDKLKDVIDINNFYHKKLIKNIIEKYKENLLSINIIDV
jgi:hypothetical protein